MMDDSPQLPDFSGGLDGDGREESEGEPTTTTEDPGSILSGLRAQAEELRKERSTVLDIPGWEGRLVMRVVPLPWPTTKKIAKQYERSPAGAERELASALDSLINACDEIMAIDPDTQLPIRLQQVAPSIVTDDANVRLDEVLTDVLGWPKLGSAREVLRKLVPVETAIFDLQARFDAWQKGAIEGDDSGK